MSFSSNFESDSYTRQELISQTEECFEEANYKISKIQNSSCIDIIAEQANDTRIKDYIVDNKTNIRVFLKILGNLNTFKDKQSKDIRLLSYIGGGVPLLIASRYAKNKQLENGIVYNRYTISSINFKTLALLLKNNINPTQIAIRGKNEPLVSINGLELENFVKSLENFTQQEICQKLNISRQSLTAYQKETIKPTITKYKEIVTFLGNNLLERSFQEIDKRLRKPLALFVTNNNDLDIDHKTFNDLNSITNNDLKIKINTHLEKLKFNKFWFQSLPWDGLITYQDKKSPDMNNPYQDTYTRKVFTGVVDSKTEPNLYKKRLEKSSKIFEFLNQTGIWLIDSDDLSNIDEDNINTKNIFIMSTEEFFDIKESRTLKRQINDTLQKKNQIDH
ncbi:MAG: hypothetical protein HeimC3_06260 [Candidatus Heimdallarchaeota archaeon LC_3]|nr:MAG: hypothetical protein HeimC3_06260 [Candidatus Heimdallarchaeota archaeon LC_3]